MNTTLQPAVKIPTPKDCSECGACCREAYHVVEIDGEDPFTQTHSSLLILQDGRWTLPRPGGRCVCLRGTAEAGGFRCSVYEQRPETCSDFEVGGENCLEARARIGIG